MLREPLIGSTPVVSRGALLVLVDDVPPEIADRRLDAGGLRHRKHPRFGEVTRGSFNLASKVEPQ